jgi:hypothetical protein
MLYVFIVRAFIVSARIVRARLVIMIYRLHTFSQLIHLIEWDAPSSTARP